jgi:alcohol dehydrogenase class IV
VLLPAVLRFNAPVAEEKYARLRAVIGLEPGADLAGWVTALNARIGLPGGLAEMGVGEAVLTRVAVHAEEDASTETNPRPVTRQDYERLLVESM